MHDFPIGRRPSEYSPVSSPPVNLPQQPATETKAPATRDKATNQTNQITNLAKHHSESLSEDNTVISRHGVIEEKSTPPSDQSSVKLHDGLRNSLVTSDRLSLYRSSIASDYGTDAKQDHHGDAPEQQHGTGSSRIRSGLAVKGVGGAFKVVAGMAGDVGKLAREGSRVAVHSEGLSEVASTTSGVLAVITLAFASYEVYQAAGEIKEGKEALTKLDEFKNKAQGQAGTRQESRTAQEITNNPGGNAEGGLPEALTKNDLEAAQADAEKIVKGEGAKQQAVLSGIEILKSGVEIAATTMEVTGHALLAHAIAAPALSILLITEGSYRLAQAHSQQKVMDRKFSKLDNFAANVEGAQQKKQAKKLKEAAEELKSSRQTHLTRSKWLAGVKIGLGVAAAGLFTAALTVSAPFVLPVLAICLVTAGVGTAITGVIHAYQKKHSENEINTVIQNAITSKAQITGEKSEVVKKVNAAAAALSGMLDDLAADPESGNGLKIEDRKNMVSYLTDRAFFKEETEQQLVRDLLFGLNSNNLDTSKAFLLGTLTKRML